MNILSDNFHIYKFAVDIIREEQEGSKPRKWTRAQFFSKQQTDCFLDVRTTPNGLFRSQDEFLCGRNEAASEACSLGAANGYGSENDVFLLHSLLEFVKSGSMLPGKFIVQEPFSLALPKMALQADFTAIRGKFIPQKGEGN